MLDKNINFVRIIYKVLIIQFLIYAVLYFPIAYITHIEFHYMFANGIDMRLIAYPTWIFMGVSGICIYLFVKRKIKITVSKWYLLIVGSINEYILYMFLCKYQIFFYEFGYTYDETISSEPFIDTSGVLFNWVNPLHIQSFMTTWLFFAFLTFTICHFIYTKKIKNKNH